MQQLGLKFKVVPSDYEENMRQKLRPAELAKLLSRGKAEAVARKYKNAIVIGADTFVVFREKFLGKPKTKAEARKMLKALSGKINSVITAYTIIDSDTGKTISDFSETKVYFRKISDKEIDAYIASGEPMDKAGAYAGQSLGGIFISKVEGDFFGLIGLPLHKLVLDLKKFGVKVL